MNAGSGLGRGIALGFAKAGALGVVFADVNLDAATSVGAPRLWITCGKLGQRGKQSIVCACPVFFLSLIRSPRDVNILDTKVEYLIDPETEMTGSSTEYNSGRPGGIPIPTSQGRRNLGTRG